jgi:acetyl esterase/lipase
MPAPELDILKVRERSRLTFPAATGPVPGLVEEEITIPARDGYQIPARIHRPETTPSGGSPLIVMYHGGGYCVGDPNGEALNCRAFVKYFGAVCVNVDYRLAPGKERLDLLVVS